MQAIHIPIEFVVIDHGKIKAQKIRKCSSLKPSRHRMLTRRTDKTIHHHGSRQFAGIVRESQRLQYLINLKPLVHLQARVYRSGLTMILSFDIIDHDRHNVFVCALHA